MLASWALSLVIAFSPPSQKARSSVVHTARGSASYFSRRALFETLAVASPLAFTTSAHAAADLEAKPLSDKAPLTVSLLASRAAIDSCPALLTNKKWDEVRKTTSELLTTMTFSGYTGESVKARAAAWSYAGDAELSRAILTRRLALIRNINVLETAIFAAQTSNKKSMLSADELQAALTEIAVELDGLIPLLGCDARWKSGKCEILPPPGERSIQDLVAGSKF